MACYHFTIKADKKPTGTQISAKEHIDYVIREGKYQNIDQERALKEQQFQGNAICPTAMGQDNKMGKKLSPLYRSLYGSIADNGHGLETSAGASVETMHIALALAGKKYGNELSVEGSAEYKAKIIVAATELDLPIHFADPTMEQQHLKLKEKYGYGRENIGGSRTERSTGAEFYKSNTKPVSTIGKKAPPQRRHRLHGMSELGMVHIGKESDLLLSGNVSDNLDHGKTNGNQSMRRDISRARRIAADRVANQILTTTTGNVQGASHVDYIYRNEAFVSKGGCIYKDHHLPKWAKDDAKTFFKAADLYEGIGYCRYKEIEFALPNEVPLDQQKEIINQFLKNHLKDFYYAYAIHDKIGVMSNGEHNTHVHIMFSERKIDDRERAQERTAKEFFARPSFSKKLNKETGGCRKDEKWNGKYRNTYLCEMRKDFAMIQNQILEKHGHDVQVDHRTLEAQRKDAFARGDFRLAKLLDRLPEKHIGPDAAADKSNHTVVDLQKYRMAKAEKRQLLFAADMLEVALEKDTTLLDVKENRNKFADLAKSTILKFPAAASSLARLKTETLDAIKENTALKNIVIWNDQAFASARLSFMTMEERELTQRVKELYDQRKSLRQFEATLEEPASYNPEAVAVYKELKKEMAAKQADISHELKSLSKSLKVVSDKLASPAMQEKIKREAYKILDNDKPMKKMLAESNKKVDALMEQLSLEVQKYESKKAEDVSAPVAPKEHFTAKEIAEDLSSSIKELTTEQAKNIKKIKELSHKVISLPRAEEMAMNIFTKGEMKALREQQRLIQKDSDRLDVARTEYKKAQQTFAALPKPSWFQSKDTYRAEEEKLKEMKHTLSQREKAFDATVDKISAETDRLASLCESDAGQRKIAEITRGILMKNAPIAEKYAALTERQVAVNKQLKQITGLKQGVATQAMADKGKNITYKVKAAGGSSEQNKPGIIAAALNGNHEMAKLVARFEDEQEIYNGMSALDMKLAIEERAMRKV